MGGLPAPAELQPARLQYRRSAKLGKGAFGDVYRGVLDAESAVAVKVLRAGSVIAARQFRRELRRYSRLSVHGVVNFYGAARSGGPNAHIDVFVTELMHGGSLLAALDVARESEARLNPAVALRIAEMIANGLAEIHACGFSHGDVKPSNVLFSASVNEAEVAPRLRAKFVDFGLSRNLTPNDDAVDSDDDADESLPLAQPGAPAPIEPLGTPAYLAPEAWRGSAALRKKNIALAADVYALGILLYELDTGLAPWPSMSEWSIFGAVYHNAERPPWPRDYEESIPGLRSVIEKCWAQDFMNRPTAESVAASLRELRRNAGLSSPSISSPGNSMPSSPAIGLQRQLEEDMDKGEGEVAQSDEHSEALKAMRMIPLPDSPVPSSPLPDWIKEQESVAKAPVPAQVDEIVLTMQEGAHELPNGTYHTTSLPPPESPIQESCEIGAVEAVQQGHQQPTLLPSNDLFFLPQPTPQVPNVFVAQTVPEVEANVDEPQSPGIDPLLSMSDKKQVEWQDLHDANKMLKFFGPRPPSFDGEDGEDDFRISITSSQAFADAEGSVKSRTGSHRTKSDGVDSLIAGDAPEVNIPDATILLAGPQTPLSTNVHSLEKNSTFVDPATDVPSTPAGIPPLPTIPHFLNDTSSLDSPLKDKNSPPAEAHSAPIRQHPENSSFSTHEQAVTSGQANIHPVPVLPRDNSLFASPGNDLISSQSSDEQDSDRSFPRSPAQISAASSTKTSIKSQDAHSHSVETPTSPNSVPSSAFARARMKSPGNMRFVGRPRDTSETSERIGPVSVSKSSTKGHAPVPRLPTIPTVEDDSSKLLSFDSNSLPAPVSVTKLDYPLKAEVQANDLNAVLNALTASTAAPDDCAHALRALAILVSGHEENPIAAVSAGALDTIAVAVARHARRHPQLARAACDAIYHLATRQLADVECELRANGACEHVISAMRWHPANVQVMQAASMALSALCRSSPAMCAIVVAQGGLNAAQRALSRAAKAFDGDVPVAVSALDAVAALADAHPNAVAGSGALPVVLRACETFAREQIDENVVRVLHSAARHEDGRNALLAEPSTVPLLAQLMERSRMSSHAGPTLILACDVVAELAMGPNQLATRALAGSSIVESVLMAMALVDSIEPFNAGTALAVHSLVSLRRFTALGLDMCGVLQNAHALDAVVNVVNCRLENMDVAIQAAVFVSSLVSKLSGGPHMQTGIEKALDMLRALDETWLLEVRVLEPVRQAIEVLEKTQGGRMGVIRMPAETIQMAPVKAKNLDRLSGRGLFRWRKR